MHRPMLAAALVLLGSTTVPAQLPAPEPLSAGEKGVPHYVVDATWPKPLPGKWILGQVSGVAVDAQDHVWIVHRPRTITAREAGAVQSPPLSECCIPAPAVVEFDQQGNVLRAWGSKETYQDWPSSEHTIYVDKKNNVWLGSNGRTDQVLLKFSPDGKLLLTIGQWGKTGGSNDTTLLGQPAGVDVDEVAHEVYVADGYGNRRVIVFDSETGKFKRYWGAYGKKPEDGPLPPYDPEGAPSQQFRAADPAVVAVHAVRLDKDGLVYVADRGNDRIQVFRKNGEFVKEVFIAKKTLAMGSTWDLAFSTDPEQRYLFVPDGTNQKVWILTRKDLKIVGSFGRGGRNAGYFGWVHNIAVDSKGTLYTTEVDIYKRVQRFVAQKQGGAP
jgi:DNA-binding beta-propeller fold protein YncE